MPCLLRSLNSTDSKQLVCCLNLLLHWLGRSYFSVILSCKVPYFNTNLHVVTPRTAECGLCFPATSVSGTVTCIRALCYAVWCMGGWLVSTGPTSYRTYHIMNSINPWIHLLNEFIYNWKSLISLLAKSCAILVALRYLTSLVIFWVICSYT